MGNKLLMISVVVLVALGHVFFLALPMIFDFDGLHLVLWLLLMVEIVSKRITD